MNRVLTIDLPLADRQSAGNGRGDLLNIGFSRIERLASSFTDSCDRNTSYARLIPRQSDSGLAKLPTAAPEKFFVEFPSSSSTNRFSRLFGVFH
jgi:hypothetical protein